MRATSSSAQVSLAATPLLLNAGGLVQPATAPLSVPECGLPCDNTSRPTCRPRAAVFFQQQGEVLGSEHAPHAAPRRPPRESLLVVARNSQVKHKISAFDTAGPNRPASLQPGRPGSLKPSVGLGRHVGSAHPLGAIAEEAAGVAAASLPSRRHVAVVSTAGGPARRHADVAVVAAPAPVAVPSPATRQQVAQRQHEACFPSILFQPPKAQPLPREPLPGAAMPVLPPPVVPTVHPHPLPSVLAPVLRSSLSPPAASTAPATAPPGHQALAALLAAEAAAAVGAADLDDEQFVDADSGSGSGPPSNENSAGEPRGVAEHITLLAVGGLLRWLLRLRTHAVLRSSGGAHRSLAMPLLP